MTREWCGLVVGMAIMSATAGVTAAAEKREAEGAAGSTTEVRPAIRAFDLPTLEKLGREIYRHDQLAWVATDVLFATIDRDALEKEPSVGWVVDVSGENPLVRFLRPIGDDGIEAAYDVVFPKEGKPTAGVPKDRSVTAEQRAAHRASRVALEALATKRRPWCGGRPNTVVLPDPDGGGFLVYILRAKPSVAAVPVGGHYRITVGADGLMVEQMDQLFASCLTMDRDEAGKEGGRVVALSMSHIVSDTPLETHVFLSLQEKMPFFVITPDAHMWSIDDGFIKPAD